MTDKELDDLFQHTLSGHRMPVPPDMWQRVNPQEEKRRRGAFLWWTVLGVAALFLIAGTAVWLYQAPSKNTHRSEVKRTATQESGSSPQNKTVLPAHPADVTNSSALSGSANESSSSQKTSADNKTGSRHKDFYTHQDKEKEQIIKSGAVASGQQSPAANSTGNTTTGDQTNTQANSDHNTGNDKTGNSLGSDNSTVTSSGNEPSTPAQKPDSNTIASANNPAMQTAKAATVKVKKIHGEKTPALELMVAGYGNSRNIYDNASQLRAGGVVTFGPINTKEKVLMHSFSINARVDKPLTKNMSVKTGLQFLQTRQRVSYSFESVSQSLSIDALTNDTTVSARLQSKQSAVKGTYNSLSVPVLISYHTNGAKLAVGATAGIVVNVLSWYNGRVPDADNGQINSAKNIYRAHTGASLYAGITAAKQVGSFQLFAEPHIQYTLSSITKSSASFRQKITGYGFGIGIRKTIGK